MWFVNIGPCVVCVGPCVVSIGACLSCLCVICTRFHADYPPLPRLHSVCLRLREMVLQQRSSYCRSLLLDLQQHVPQQQQQQQHGPGEEGAALVNITGQFSWF